MTIRAGSVADLWQAGVAFLVGASLNTSTERGRGSFQRRRARRRDCLPVECLRTEVTGGDLPEVVVGVPHAAGRLARGRRGDVL